MIRYNIHNIVEVFVDDKVSTSIKNDIDFQIMHFKTSNNKDHSKKQINI